MQSDEDREAAAEFDAMEKAAAAGDWEALGIDAPDSPPGFVPATVADFRGG